MVTPVVIPDKERLPAIPDAADPQYVLIKNAREMLNTLHADVRLYAKDRGRIRGLVAFKERAHVVTNADGEETRHTPMSQVRHGDRQEIELYLKRRDIVMDLEETEKILKEKLKSLDFNENTAEIHHRMTSKLDRLEEKRLKHMAAMEHMLDCLAKGQDRHVQIMAKMASDAAKIAQAAIQHEDKMEIARDVTKVPSVDDLMTKLAMKHNIPVDQVRAILSAKTVEAGSDDT